MNPLLKRLEKSPSYALEGARKKEPLTKYPVVEPDAETLDYFKKNPSTTGMAIGAGLNKYSGERRVVLNPYSGLSKQEQEGLVINERLRHFMDETKPKLSFEPTQDQVDSFRGTEYGKPENIGRLKETIVARILTGDASAGNFTKEQEDAAMEIQRKFQDQSKPQSEIVPALMKAFDKKKAPLLK